MEKIVPVAPSPLDAYRGRGQVAKKMGLPVPAQATRLMTLGCYQDETITHCVTIPKMEKVVEGATVETKGNPSVIGYRL